MKFNARPGAVAFLDYETYSAQDISEGARKYASHPSTKVLCCVVRVDGRVHRLEDGFERLPSICAGRTIVAHNAPFDSAVWERALGLPPAEWYDTVPVCRAAGLPGGLDDVGKTLFGRGKDPNGKRLIDMLCVGKQGRQMPAHGPAHKLLLEYCVRDVELLEQIYNRVSSFCEPDVVTVDRVINDRGIPIDRELLVAIRDMLDHNARVNGELFSEHTGGVNPKSSKQVIEWLGKHGFNTSSVNKTAINKLLGSPEELYVGDDGSDFAAAFECAREAVELRREMVGVGSGKVENALRVLDDDDRIRDALVYYGAHTGRWASRRLQLHNMPSGIKGLDVRYIEPTYESVKAVAAALSKRTGANVVVSDVLGTMLRRLVKADNFLMADYNAVEARCVAWMSDEPTMLKMYNDPHGGSVYLDMGERVFGRPISKKDDPMEYTLSKALVLGCSYGMSGKKFNYTINLRESRATLERLKSSGVSVDDAVKTYRTAYPRIPLLWKAMHEACHSCVKGCDSYAGKCHFAMVGADMHMVLPSGRPLVYRNARIEMQVPAYCAMYGMPETPVPTVIYDAPRGRGFLYGSKATENASQAICRDMLAEALAETERVGLNPILHIHDEIVCANSEDRLQELVTIMTVPPVWASNFPVLVEGYSGDRWGKVVDGFKECKMFNGRLVL